MPDEKPFFFPPFHPGCRCTIVAVKAPGGEGLSHADMASYNAEVFDAHYPVDDNLQILSIPKDWDDVSSLAQAKLLMQSILPGVDIDLGGIDADVAPIPFVALDNAVKELSKYPAACPAGLKSLKFISAAEGAEELGTANSLAWALDDGSGIVLNVKYWKTAKKLEDTVENMVDAGVFQSCAVANPEQYVAAHEIGHVAYANLSVEAKRQIQKLYKTYVDYEQPFSRVSCQDANEFFAEVFAHMVMGGPLSKTEQALKKILEGS